MFWNLIKTIHGHVLNVNFEQDFQSSPQTDVPYRNGIQNSKTRDVYSRQKRIAPSPSTEILNICERLHKTFIFLIFEFKFLLRKLKIIGFQKMKFGFYIFYSY